MMSTALAQDKKHPGGWEFLKPRVFWAFVVVYNALAVAGFLVLRDHDYFIKILICGLGYLTLGFLLGMRFCGPFRAAVVRPEYNHSMFLKQLRFPIGLWTILPTVFLLIPNTFLDWS